MEILWDKNLTNHNYCIILKTNEGNTIMIKVEFLGPINKENIEIKAQTLQEVSNYLKKDEDLAQWLDKCAVALNDTMINDLSTSLKSGDKISILPPVCGG